MTQENAAQAALAKARRKVASNPNVRPETIVALADVEVRAEQARQQELTNLIALLATPAACPFPAQDVRNRIKELVTLK